MVQLTNLLGIVDANADVMQAPRPVSSITSMLPMLLIFAVFMYVMIVRPQSKRAKEQKMLLDGLKKGDEVVTIGGIFGKIDKIKDDFVLLNISKDISIYIQKNSISSCVPKGTLKNIG